MDRFYRPRTEESPEIILDPAKEQFVFKGHSYPEDAALFYQPVLDWLTVYTEKPNRDTHVVFDLDYFNTTSQKMVLDILLLFDKLYQAGNNVRITWHFKEDDEATEEAGEEFSEILELPFTIKPY